MLHMKYCEFLIYWVGSNTKLTVRPAVSRLLSIILLILNEMFSVLITLADISHRCTVLNRSSEYRIMKLSQNSFDLTMRLWDCNCLIFDISLNFKRYQLIDTQVAYLLD